MARPGVEPITKENTRGGHDGSGAAEGVEDDDVGGEDPPIVPLATSRRQVIAR